MRAFLTASSVLIFAAAGATAATRWSGVWVPSAPRILAIIKELKDGHVTVFVPVAPTPGLGFLQIVSRSNLEKLECSMSDALGWPLTWGRGPRPCSARKLPKSVG